jgi:hypothetical protein
MASSESRLELLSRILEAQFDVDNCEPSELVDRKLKLDELLAEACRLDPSVSRDDLLRALADRYEEYRKERRRKVFRVRGTP